MHLMIQFMKGSSNTKCVINILIYNQLTLSYALERFILTTSPLLFLVFMLYKVSWAKFQWICEYEDLREIKLFLRD
jgi:hypothetical protein